MKYSTWFKWENRKSIPCIDEHGIYYLAFTNKNIEGASFSLLKDIIYIGVTIAEDGLNSRLYQFQRAMECNVDRVHGGAERVRFKHRDCEKFFANVYVSIWSVALSSKQNTANDLRLKGECLKHEYVSFADYLDLYKELPEFNDKARSPKLLHNPRKAKK